MFDLTTTYMGLKLKNPIIIGSAGLTDSAEKIKKLEDNGAAAVVLKSIFEEQILMESNHIQHEHVVHTEELDYIRNYTRDHNLDEYLTVIKEAKKKVSIPIIASIHCNSASEWTSFAKKIESAGADALELNMFILPGDTQKKGIEIEEVYFNIIEAVRKQVTIPISIKVSFYFSGLANMIFNLSVRKINGIVLFNRFYRPDIDLDRMEIVSADVFSTPGENSLPLRWVGMLSDKVKCDMAATTGIHDGKTIVKNLLAGAKAVQVATAIYQKGPGHIQNMLNEIESWMKTKKIKKLSDVIGKLSYKNIDDPVKYERSQFMRYYSDNK
jgi:dihydroorotate dehydrogenase (fumarate)